MAQYQNQQIMYTMWCGFVMEITIIESGFVPYTDFVSSPESES